MRLIALMALAGCGRIGFGDHTLSPDAPNGDASTARDAAPDALLACTVHAFAAIPPEYDEYGGGTVGYTGRLEVGIPGGQGIDSGIRSRPRSFANREVAVQVVKILDAFQGLTAFGWHDANNNHTVHLYVTSGDLILERFTPPSLYQMPNRVLYDPAQHRWWQLRDRGSVIDAFTSPDGVTWNQLGAVTGFPTMTDVYADFGIDSPFTSIPPDTARFDDIVDCTP